MTAEEGFRNAMMVQMNATLKGDRKRAEKARSAVMHFRRMMEKKPN
jgi:hypothetical protein